MKFYWVKTNWLIKKIFSGFSWDFRTTDKVVYLTFDDGPTPEVTNWVLALLKEYNAKATFFCIGDNISKHSEIFSSIQKGGHSIGNHTYNHLNGWHSESQQYVTNIIKCEEVIIRNTIKESEHKQLFRPPYGKITPKQFKFLKERNYKIIMWDVLSADFDTKISPKECAENVLKNIQAGSIIIFHDSIKAYTNLKFALPQTLDYLQKNGYEMKAIELAPELKK